ncbi:MAG: phosphonopyruvate decarboxylase [Candidatus Marinimicrobia bacterium]|nr:phosphonopyruvate decarboxylase [Candidatus Neomarinimicrobiota bacterium]
MSISPRDFFDLLKKKDVNFFTGVPDSLLKEFCLCLDDLAADNHIIAANEGNAIALAAGYHLGTGKLPLVYMQNSGLGNAVNPLLSLCDPEVYSIPMLVVIGWRGEPGVADEPQHKKQGLVQEDLLNALDLPYIVLSADDTSADKKVEQAISSAINGNRPSVILVKKGTFDKYGKSSAETTEDLITREEALEVILADLPDDAIIVSTTGKTSREIFEIRAARSEPHNKDFLTVGSMGHCSSIALGIALAQPDRKIFCIDGDGALIMHMGGLATIGKLQPNNFYHILINNRVHESVGGQKTAAEIIDIPGLVKSNGYKTVLSCSDKDQLITNLERFIQEAGPAFLDLLVKPGSRANLGRPTVTPVENKTAFMKFIANAKE